MSSHREAPETSKDPVADSTDLYAFVSPDKPDAVTIIANYIPLESPAGGPNFFEFGHDVAYYIYVDNDGDAKPDITYEFRFETKIRDANTFLYNTGQILHNTDATWNRPQTYSVFKIDKQGHRTRVGRGLTCPPCNIGPRSTPKYRDLAASAVHALAHGESVFAGQRREGFYVDLGSVFDLAALRPFQQYHLLPPHKNSPGVDALAHSNVHSIALQIPKHLLTSDGSTPTSTTDSKSVIGVWTAAARRKAVIREHGHRSEAGKWVQVSRLGNPLINEVIIPMAEKDGWNATKPEADRRFAARYEHPILQDYLVALYPGVFPHLGGYKKSRVDLVAILLTGIPKGVVSPTFQNYTGATHADMLRLNMAVRPTTHNPSPFGVLGGDLAGFPNGRRVFDDTVSIELRAVAGVTIPLVDPSFKPDGAAAALYDVTVPTDRYQPHFPYLGTPLAGYEVPAA
ncbi:MAG TPA: DUF4331 domain-containing protein [Chloroflexota bacterium]|nr:DUF4331 domain-containing protein [Chloroflexota bacterium]